MAIVFNGKVLAKEKESNLKEEVKKLRKEGIKPKLVSIIVGDNPASVLYVNLKKRAADRIGAEVDVKKYDENVRISDIVHEIKNLNEVDLVHGIMVQLPLPKNFSKEDRDEIINSITKKKDVDGLREDSPFITPTVKSVLEVIREAPQHTLKARPLKCVVVGSGGFEGKKIFNVLKEIGYEIEGLDRKTKDLRLRTNRADILISVTGSPGIIGKDEIKEGVVVIDVGSPKGDVRTEEILDKAAFISPVPGGLGPVTVSCLLENLVEAVQHPYGIFREANITEKDLEEVRNSWENDTE